MLETKLREKEYAYAYDYDCYKYLWRNGIGWKFVCRKEAGPLLYSCSFV